MAERRVKLKRITITICEPCLNGEGQECHTAGCALWLHRVDLPIDPRLYGVQEEFYEDGTLIELPSNENVREAP